MKMKKKKIIIIIIIIIIITNNGPAYCYIVGVVFPVLVGVAE